MKRFQEWWTSLIKILVQFSLVLVEFLLEQLSASEWLKRLRQKRMCMAQQPKEKEEKPRVQRKRGRPKGKAKKEKPNTQEPQENEKTAVQDELGKPKQDNLISYSQTAKPVLSKRVQREQVEKDAEGGINGNSNS